MAENKSGFVLYKDLISVVKKLVLKDRENKTNYGGELFLLILEYVNDENPIAIDFILEMTFEPIKQQLKRDLKKYETKINKKSESGRIGNLKKWHSDIYKDFESGDLTLEEAENIAKNHKASHCDKKVANIADIDKETVTDNDTVTETDILLEKETKQINLSDQVSKDDFSDGKIHDAEKEKSSAKKEKFKPPSVDEVQIYCNERQNDIQAYKFVNFYQSKGWKVGNQPMKDWKAAIRTWEQKEKENGQSKTAKSLTQAARR